MQTNKLELLNEVERTSTITGGWVSLLGVMRESSKQIVVRLYATNNSGTTPTLDVALQHCYNPSSSSAIDSEATSLWAFAQVTDEEGICKEVHIPTTTVGLLPNLRVVATLGGTDPDYDITVVAYTD